MKKPLQILNAKVSRVIIAITKERNRYFVETKEQSQECFNYNLGEIKWYYDNLDQEEEFLNCFLNNDTTYRGPVYNVSIVCNNDIVEMCIQYPSDYQDKIDTDTDVVISDSELKDIIVKIMSKVSSLDIKNYKVIVEGNYYTKNLAKIHVYKEGSAKFNSLLNKISPIDVNDRKSVKNEILEKLFIAGKVLPKDKPKTVFICDGSDYKYIEINSNDIDKVKIDDAEKDYGLCYTVNSLDYESEESILEDFMNLF